MALLTSFNKKDEEKEEKRSSVNHLSETVNAKLQESTQPLSQSVERIGRSPKLREGYNNDRIEMIVKAIDSFHQGTPTVIAEIMGSYEHDESLMELYKMVMNRLGITREQERQDFDFYKDTFGSQLLSLLSLKENEITEEETQFWSNLSRLLFKWMIFIKQTVTNDKNHLNNLMDNIKEISLFISYKRMNPFPFLIPLKDMDDDYFKEFQDLMSYEFMENPTFYLFGSIIEDFYHHYDHKDKNGDGNGNGSSNDNSNENNKITDPCQRLKNIYFNGNFDSNIPLFYMLVMHDPWGKIREQCFSNISMIQDVEFSDSPSLSENMPNLEYFEFLKSHGPEDLGIVDIGSASTFIIKFYLETGKKFWIPDSDSWNLIKLLEKLKKANLLSLDVLKRLVVFESMNKNEKKDNITAEWNQEIFNQIITANIETSLVDEKDRSDFMNLIKTNDITPCKPGQAQQYI